jgi:hypothetical protein
LGERALLALRFAAGGALLRCLPSASDEVDRWAQRRPQSVSDSSHTAQSYARLALAAVLALLAWSSFRDEVSYVPLLREVDLAIYEFGHMLFMPFGIPILGRTMVILGGSLTEVAFPLLFVGYSCTRARTASGAMCSRRWYASGGPRSVYSPPRFIAPTPAPASSCSSTD